MPSPFLLLLLLLVLLAASSPGTYYATLDLEQNATLKDVKKAYRALALKWHVSEGRELFWELFWIYCSLSRLVPRFCPPLVSRRMSLAASVRVCFSRAAFSLTPISHNCHSLSLSPSLTRLSLSLSVCVSLSLSLSHPPLSRPSTPTHHLR